MAHDHQRRFFVRGRRIISIPRRIEMTVSGKTALRLKLNSSGIGEVSGIDNCFS